MTLAEDLADALTETLGRLAALESRVERLFRKGEVTDVDPKNQVYRQEIGIDDDGTPMKSPWVPYAQFAGDRRIHTPPSVGQQMLLISPDGDHEQGHGIPLTFSNDVPSPSQDGDKHVDRWGKVTTTITDKSHERDVGDMKITHDATGLKLDFAGTTFAFSASGLDVRGGRVTHDGRHIDATHRHGGVQPGGGQTAEPVG